jgi:hypothetical protein
MRLPNPNSNAMLVVVEVVAMWECGYDGGFFR